MMMMMVMMMMTMVMTVVMMMVMMMFSHGLKNLGVLIVYNMKSMCKYKKLCICWRIIII